MPVIGVQSFRWALEHNAWQPRVETILGAIVGAARDGLRPVDATFVQDFYDRVVPEIYEEFDGLAMLPLVAPRPLLVVNGDSDALTPLSASRKPRLPPNVRIEALARLRSSGCWCSRTRAMNLRRQRSGTALDWLVRWLKP